MNSKFILKLLYKIVNFLDNKLSNKKYDKYKKFYRDSSGDPKFLLKFLRGNEPSNINKFKTWITTRKYNILTKTRTIILKLLFKFEKSEKDYVITQTFKNAKGKTVKVGLMKEIKPEETFIVRQKWKQRK